MNNINTNRLIHWWACEIARNNNLFIYHRSNNCRASPIELTIICLYTTRVIIVLLSKCTPCSALDLFPLRRHWSERAISGCADAQFGSADAALTSFRPVHPTGIHTYAYVYVFGKLGKAVSWNVFATILVAYLWGYREFGE